MRGRSPPGLHGVCRRQRTRAQDITGSRSRQQESRPAAGQRGQAATGPADPGRPDARSQGARAQPRGSPCAPAGWAECKSRQPGAAEDTLGAEADAQRWTVWGAAGGPDPHPHPHPDRTCCEASPATCPRRDMAPCVRPPTWAPRRCPSVGEQVPELGTEAHPGVHAPRPVGRGAGRGAGQERPDGRAPTEHFHRQKVLPQQTGPQSQERVVASQGRGLQAGQRGCLEGGGARPTDGVSWGSAPACMDPRGPHEHGEQPRRAEPSPDQAAGRKGTGKGSTLKESGRAEGKWPFPGTRSGPVRS